MRNLFESRRRTDDGENPVKSFTSNDITSLVPCLAVKGTNLMISRGSGESMELVIKWLMG